jgi:hypothetical protein
MNDPTKGENQMMLVLVLGIFFRLGSVLPHTTNLPRPEPPRHTPPPVARMIHR